MSPRFAAGPVPVLSHQVLTYQRMTVGQKWVFDAKVDPHDKLLYVLSGWADVVEHADGSLRRRRLERGAVALVPAHLPVDYSGSSPLDKMHLYFSLEYLQMPLPLEELLSGVIVSRFAVEDLDRALAEPSMQSPLSVYRLHALVGYHLSRLLEPHARDLSRWSNRLERYANIEQTLSTRKVFTVRVSDLARAMGMAESTLSRNFRRDTGQTIKDYLKEQVIRQSKRALSGSRSIKEIAHDLGFEDEFYFSKYFKRETGFSPSAYRESLARELG